MLVRKLRIEKGWSQETLAEVSGLSVRTIQRVERGGNASLETLGALAAVLETDISSLSKEPDMHSQHAITEAERDALAYVRDIKGFYSHLAAYCIAVAGFFLIWLFTGADYPWFIWPTLGWGIGVASHGFAVFEVLSLFGADWERRQVQKRLASGK